LQVEGWVGMGTPKYKILSNLQFFIYHRDNSIYSDQAEFGVNKHITNLLSNLVLISERGGHGQLKNSKFG